MLASGCAVCSPDKGHQSGNSCITTARYLPPEQFDRVPGGALNEGRSYNNRSVSSAAGGGTVQDSTPPSCGRPRRWCRPPPSPVGLFSHRVRHASCAADSADPALRGARRPLQTWRLSPARADRERHSRQRRSPASWIASTPAPSASSGTCRSRAPGNSLLVIVRDPGRRRKQTQIDLLMKVSMAGVMLRSSFLVIALAVIDRPARCPRRCPTAVGRAAADCARCWSASAAETGAGSERNEPSGRCAARAACQQRWKPPLPHPAILRPGWAWA